MLNEPIHASASDAIRWVDNNTDNAIFHDPVSKRFIRVDANGSVLVLNHNESNDWWWSMARRTN